MKMNYPDGWEAAWQQRYRPEKRWRYGDNGQTITVHPSNTRKSVKKRERKLRVESEVNVRKARALVADTARIHAEMRDPARCVAVLPSIGTPKKVRKPSQVSALKAEIKALKARIAELESQQPAELPADPQLPKNIHIDPWTDPNGREYRTLTKVGRGGYAKHLAIPRTAVAHVAAALLRSA